MKTVLILLCSIILFANNTQNIKTNYTPLMLQDAIYTALHKDLKVSKQTMSYKEMVQEVLKSLPKEEASKLLANLFDRGELLEQIPFDEKLKFFKTMQDANIENQYQIFTLYRVLSNGYMWRDTKKELRLQMQNIDYFIKHYEEYKSLIINNTDKLYHLQPDIYSEIMILGFKENIKDKKLLDEYIKKMREFSKVFEKDVTNYSMQTLLVSLSDKRMDEIDATIAKKLKDVYAKKVKENKKEIFILDVVNYELKTYIYIFIEFRAKYAPSILEVLKKDRDFPAKKMEYSLEFTKDMTRTQVIKKLLKYYNLENANVSILKSDMQIHGNKI
jgi:hypothetical protein